MNSLSYERLDVCPRRRFRRLHLKGRPRFVGKRTFKNADESNPMGLRIFDGASLEAIGRDEDSLLSTGRPHPVSKHLDVLTLNGSQMVLAFDEDEEVYADGTEPCGCIDFVPPIRSTKDLAVLHPEAFQTLASFGQQINDEPFER